MKNFTINQLKKAATTFYLLLGLQLVIEIGMGQSPSFGWLKPIGNVSGETAQSTAVDGAGNTYTLINFNGTTDMDPGAGVYNLTVLGNTDNALVKLDPSGNFVWAKQFGGPGYDKAGAVEIDNAGNIYLTGAFGGTADFDPGAGISNLTSTGAYDLFILKLDAAGNFTWVKRIGGNGTTWGTAIAIDNSGNVTLAGVFTWSTDINPGAAVSWLTSPGTGTTDGLVVQLDMSGNLLWACQFGSTGHDNIYGLTRDNTGNVIVTGSFTGTVDLDPGVGVCSKTTAGASDIFIVKLSNMGSYTWGNSFGGIYNDVPQAASVDQSGNIYTTGYFAGTVDFDPGAGVCNLSTSGPWAIDCYISAFSGSGNFMWAKSIGGATDDTGWSIAVDAMANVYVTGVIQMSADLNTGSGVMMVTSIGVQDIFVVKLDMAGNFIYGGIMGSTGIDMGSDIAVDASLNVYLCGYFANTADMDPGAGVLNFTASGPNDAFVQRLGAPVPLPVSLVSFEAKNQNAEVFLSWITATETNNDYFTVERSKDGITFTTLEVVQGKGNSTKASAYRIYDVQPFTGTTYYRLKQTDFNGETVALKTVAITNANAVSALTCIVNEKNITVKFNGSEISNVSCLVYDGSGRQVTGSRSLHVEGNEVLLDCSVLKTGIYYLHLASAETSVVEKVILK